MKSRKATAVLTPVATRLALSTVKHALKGDHKRALAHAAALAGVLVVVKHLSK